jgi:hypothetical protein
MTLTRRKDNSFFRKYSISDTAFSSAPTATWNFTSIGIALMIESDDSADVIEYSFDGVTIHGDMTPLMPSEAIIFDNRFHSKVWFRRATAGAAVTVRVEAWRNES